MLLTWAIVVFCPILEVECFRAKIAGLASKSADFVPLQGFVIRCLVGITAPPFVITTFSRTEDDMLEHGIIIPFSTVVPWERQLGSLICHTLKVFFDCD